MPGSRMYLSPPHATDEDVAAVVAALRSGWLAPVGPDLREFETRAAAVTGRQHAVALSSGTAALQLSLKYVGIQPGDHVLIPTLTFGATAFAVCYLGAVPVFVDVDDSWNMDAASVEAILDSWPSGLPMPVAAIPVDLYGAPADYDSLLPILVKHSVAVIEDAAEGLGATHVQGPLGSFGRAAALSFNGNKIITTSGGGMVVTDDEEMAAKIRFWATQSREPLPWYEHEEVGFNFRLSNVLAALGRSQLNRLSREVEKRRQIRLWYQERLEEIDGVEIQMDPTWGRSNAWLTVARFSTERYPNAPHRIIEALEKFDIESRYLWKPMHQQPVFRDNRAHLTGRADRLFRECVCLPSGTLMSKDDVDRVTTIIRSVIDD